MATMEDQKFLLLAEVVAEADQMVKAAMQIVRQQAGRAGLM
jgi:hypothetical protein